MSASGDVAVVTGIAPWTAPASARAAAQPVFTPCVMRRVGSSWTDPEPILAPHAAHADREVTITPDGESVLWMHVERAPGSNEELAEDVRIVRHLEDGSWSAPRVILRVPPDRTVRHLVASDENAAAVLYSETGWGDGSGEIVLLTRLGAGGRLVTLETIGSARDVRARQRPASGRRHPPR